MFHTLKWGAALALALSTLAGPALADDDHRRSHHGYDDRNDDRYDRRDARRDDRDYRRDHRRDDRQARRDYRHDRRYDRRDYAYERAYYPPVRVVRRPVARNYYPAPRYVASPRWARGGYVHHYRQPVYVVSDYRGYGLRHPPRGYHWMRDDYGDYLLVAVATGLIADLILR